MNDKNNRKYMTKDSLLKKYFDKQKKFNETISTILEYQGCTWEQYLVVKFLAMCCYGTNGQMVRYLEALKSAYDSELNATAKVVNQLTKSGFIKRAKKPINFKKGVLKDSKLSAYFLTKVGKKFLKLVDEDIAEMATVGEPKGKTLDNLQHDILVSEVFVQLHELGHYVIWITPERSMRSEASKQAWERWEYFADASTNNLSDFRIAYFNKDTSHISVREGEVAVKYNRQQILSKNDGLWWFCYDRREAQKIHLLKKVMPMILTSKLLEEVQEKKLSKTYSVRKDVQEKAKFLSDFVKTFGGITPENAADFAKLSVRRVRPKLQMIPNAFKSRDSLQPGATIGSGRVIYFDKSLAKNYGEQRNVFVLNLLMEFLRKKGYKLAISKGMVLTKNPKTGVVSQMISDGSFMDDNDIFEAKIESVRKRIQEGKKKNLETIIGISDTHNFLKYKRQPLDAKLVNLNSKPSN